MAAAMSAPPIDDRLNFNANIDVDIGHDAKLEWNTKPLLTPGVAGKRISRLSLLSSSSKKERFGDVDDETTATSPPSYLESPPRPLHFETIALDFAYPTTHFLHYNPNLISSDAQHSRDNSPLPSARRSSSSHARRSSETGQSSTMNTGINSGSHWQPGIWGGDGAVYEEMEPLPRTAFRSSTAGDEGWNPRQHHRKSRSYADVYSYERGRRRDNSSNGSRSHSASKRASCLSGSGESGGYSDPAGREALRASRGLEPQDAEEEEEETMYTLSLQQHSSGRPRRDSHVAQQTLPSRRYHEEDSGTANNTTNTTTTTNTTAATLLSDLPLDHESTELQDLSPHRESLGPEDEELFAGPSLALYDFEPENENELRVREREIIMVSYRHGQGWLVAQNASGDAGLVPEAYVRLLSEMEDWEGVVEEEPEEEQVSGPVPACSGDGYASRTVQKTAVERDREDLRSRDSGFS